MVVFRIRFHGPTAGIPVHFTDGRGRADPGDYPVGKMRPEINTGLHSHGYGCPIDAVAVDRAARDVNIMEFGAGSPQQVEKPYQLGAPVIAIFQEGSLDIDGNTVVDQFGYDVQAFRRNFIGMDKVGGHFHSFSCILQLAALQFQIIQEFTILGEKQMWIISNGPGRQAERLNMRDLHESIDGAAQVVTVQKGIAPREDNLLDRGGISDMIDSLPNIGNGRILLVSGFLVFSKAEPAIHRTRHVQKENDPILVHLFQQSLVKLSDPGIGISHGIEFFYKGQILIGHIFGNPHLADCMHGQTHRISVDDLLHVLPVLFRNLYIDEPFQLGNVPYGNEFISRNKLFQNSHQQQVRQLDTVYSYGLPEFIVGRFQIASEGVKETRRIIFKSHGFQ